MWIALITLCAIMGLGAWLTLGYSDQAAAQPIRRAEAPSVAAAAASADRAARCE